MLRSLQIADQIARTGHMPVRRLDLIWISARNAARRELDLGVAALVEAVTLLTADVEGSTRPPADITGIYGLVVRTAD
ncbi:transcriptional regulator [Mycobacterium tuberculosis]|nr:transcriptional regulator [Mycobacterium tuberculosis]CKS73409.1 transcriptional regulator [Mycobacterium tuberculosis]CKW04691.1 transcriptional regulator [Mycobacterium tuberculosis]CRD07875.1 transcriptional regulator [Mycobacterium tuberculosis]